MSALATYLATYPKAGELEALAQVIIEGVGTTPPTGGATSAKQDTQITAEQAILAKIIAAPATEAKQDTGNTSLGTISTNVAKTIPATTAEAVTPSDSTVLASRAVWIGGTGDLSVRLSGAPSTTVVFTNVPDGTLLPLSVVRVMAATDATDIVVLA